MVTDGSVKSFIQDLSKEAKETLKKELKELFARLEFMAGERIISRCGCSSNHIFLHPQKKNRPSIGECENCGATFVWGEQ